MRKTIGEYGPLATAPYGELMVFLPDSIHHECEFFSFPFL